jgi:hypothetical protein
MGGRGPVVKTSVIYLGCLFCAVGLIGCETTGGYSYAPTIEPTNEEIMLQLEHMERMQEIESQTQEIRARTQEMESQTLDMELHPYGHF